MKRELVSSPNMNSIGWESNILEIEFHDGSVKTYKDVSYAEYCGFLSRASLGASLMHLWEHHGF